MNHLTVATLLLAVLLTGCVRPEVHWPPKEGSHELVIVGPFVEAQDEKDSEFYRVLEEAVPDLLSRPFNKNFVIIRFSP